MELDSNHPEGQPEPPENARTAPKRMDWREAIAAWRRLPPEEKQRIRLARIPLNVAESMAFEGEPVDIEELKRQHLEFMRKNFPHLIDKEKAMSVNKLTLDVLKQAVAGSDAAFRSTLRLMPAGGPGSKVFPPTFAGGVYAWERRRLSADEVVDTVVLDQVPAQANRMEEALLDAHCAGALRIPMLEVDFSAEFPDIGAVTTLDAPHRIADAIFRDSLLDGVKFRESAIGQAFASANIRNATPLFERCPNALIFGVWDSTGSAGGLGNKFQRVVSSEIVGFGAERNAFHGGVRSDPLGVKAAATVYETESGDWTNDSSGPDLKRNAKGEATPLRPSEFNHSNILVNSERDETGSILKGGVTIVYATQIWVLSLPAVRRLRFPVGGRTRPEIDTAARTVLAALALAAYAHMLERGFDLRSRCLLIPEGMAKFEIVAANGVCTPYYLDVTLADDLLKQAIRAAREAGLNWPEEPVRLAAEPKLIELIRRSRALGNVSGD